MANFDTSATKRQAVKEANNLLPNIQSAYHQLKLIQEMLARYQAGTDPAFNGAINALFSAGERTELNAMLTSVNPLVTDWETNHSTALSG